MIVAKIHLLSIHHGEVILYHEWAIILVLLACSAVIAVGKTLLEAIADD